MLNNLDHIMKEVVTPAYVFDMNTLYQRVDYLKERLPSNVHLCFAMKANPFLVKALASKVHKLEVCSPGEYYICEQQGIDPNQLVISGVYKTPEEIEHMLQVGVTGFTVESMNQWLLLERLTQQYNKNIHVLLRLTSGNQFGMNEMEVRSLIEKRDQFPHMHIEGIQYFSGTQKTSMKRIAKECAKVDQLLIDLYNDYGFESEVLEFGPGFPVYYFMEGKSFDEETYLKEFSNCISNMHYQGDIVLELGRSIVASCGSYLTRVVDMKENDNGGYVILDGGMHHMAYYGQMMAMKHPIYQLYPLRENTSPKSWNLCGALCTINDLIVKQLEVTDLKLNDVFVFENTGAYSMCEGISLFLSRDLPAVYFLEGETIRKVRQHLPTYPMNMERGR